MTNLTFNCPKTGHHMEAGFEMDGQTHRRLKILFARVRCPHCGFEHFPQIKRGDGLSVSRAEEDFPSAIDVLMDLLDRCEGDTPAR